MGIRLLIYRGEGRKGRQEKGRKRHRNRDRKPGSRKLHTQQRREWPGGETGGEAGGETGGEAGTSQLHSRHKKGHMTNTYLMHSDGEAIVDFVKDHEELYKTNEHFKDKARKECLGLPMVTSSLSKCARLGSNLAMANSCSPSMARLQEK